VKKKWKIAVMLAAIAALNFGDRTAIASVYPLLRSDLGLSDLMIAAVGSTFLWSYALGSPVAGYLADRLSRSRMTIFGLTAWSVVMLLTGFVHNPTMLLMTRVLLGFAECTFIPASTALIADHHGTETRATAIALQLAGTNIGLIGGATLAGYVGERFGWRLDFFFLGCIGILLAGFASFVLSDGPSEHNSVGRTPFDWHGAWQLLLTPAYVGVVSAAMLISISTWTFLNWLPLYLYDRFHLSLAVSGLSSSTALQIPAIAGVLLGGFVSDRFAAGSTRRRLLLLCLGYFAAAPFLLPFLWKTPLNLLSLSVLLFSFIKAVGSVSECPIICELAGQRLASTGIGILNMANCIAGGLGIFWAGALKRHYGLGTSFGSLTITVIGAGVAVLIGYRAIGRREMTTIAPDNASISLEGAEHAHDRS
jgi:predicted MFS family arabinose efflux permease